MFYVSAVAKWYKGFLKVFLDYISVLELYYRQ